MTNTATRFDRIRHREAPEPGRRSTDTAQDAGESTITVSFTSLVLMSIFIVFVCAAVAALLL